MYRYILFLLLAPSFGTFADIYKHIDEHGKVTFSDSPSKDSERVQIKETNVSTKRDVAKSWPEWITYSEPMQISFGQIHLMSAIKLISEHAKSEDGVEFVNNLSRRESIRIQFHWVPWAQIIERLSKEYKFNVRCENDVITISEISTEPAI